MFTADPRIVPTARRIRRSATTRFSKCRRAAPRCSHCDAWSMRSGSRCRCMCAARSRTVRHARAARRCGPEQPAERAVIRNLQTDYSIQYEFLYKNRSMETDNERQYRSVFG
ncbi:hypothetical protein [Bifidobacterium animalis]|uniref:hypothetical protein n=1 Tax=Bifidobacterium animalis TaxID=28025 RepID=UPI001EE4D83E|nr:hypothetical protein [Bifidobacterium animalis]